MIRERDIEKYLCSQVEQAGGLTRKLTWIGRVGAPDRFVALNGVWLVELKSPTGEESKLQTRERNRLLALGVRCIVINSLEGVDNFVSTISSTTA
jgi:hypothetical protein